MPEIPVSWATRTKKTKQNKTKKQQKTKQNKNKKQKQKQSPVGYARDKAKYAQYFKGNKILPISELVEAVQPKTIYFIVTDLKTRRLAGIKKDTFEELLKAAGIPAKYFCRSSFDTWNVLLSTEELAAKLPGSNISSKFFRLQPEYKGQGRIRVTVCNVPIQLNGDVLTAYSGVEDITTSKSFCGTAHGDYLVTMCLDRVRVSGHPPCYKIRGSNHDGGR